MVLTTPPGGRGLPSFGNVRALLQQPPSDRAWYVLCQMLEAWPSEQERDHMVVPYVEGYLAKWPDATRVVPDRWIEDGSWFTGELGPIGRLARKLYLGNKIKDAQTLRALLQAPDRDVVTVLDLGWNSFDDEAIEQLVGASGFASLRALNLCGNPIGPKLASLTHSELVRGLEHLSLMWCSIHPPALMALKALEEGHPLVHLDLSRNNLGALGMVHLMSHQLASRLEVLNLGKNAIGDEGLKIMLDRGRELKLKSVDLGSNHLSDEGTKALANSQMFHGLQDLKLVQNEILDEGLIALVRSPGAYGLRSLSVVGNGFGVAGVEALARSPHLTTLRSLEVPTMTPEASEALANSPFLHDSIRAQWR